MTALADLEAIDERSGLGLRRVVVGPLDTNCWIVFCTATRSASIIDPGDEPRRVIDAVADLRVERVLLTHTHWDHVLGVPEVADHYGVDVLAHADDDVVWPHELDHLHHHGHFDAGTATHDLLRCGASLAPPADRAVWDGATTPLRDRQRIVVGEVALDVLHTPGHTPGGVSFVAGRSLVTGDTLFPGGPGLTGWPLSDFPTIMASVRRLLELPADMSVHPGHGASTTIGEQRPQVEEWAARGW